MFPCTVLTCAFLFFHGVHDRSDTRDQLRLHSGSADTSWVQLLSKKAPIQIRGPFWTLGLALGQTTSKSLWMVPGPTGLGSTVGMGVTLAF